MSDTELPRETGSEKVDATCATCGKELPAVTSPYGSVVRGACPECEVPAEGQLEAQKAAAEEGGKAKVKKDSDG